MVTNLIYPLQDSWKGCSYSIKAKRPDKDHQTVVLGGNKYNTESQIEANFPTFEKLKVFRLDTYFSTEIFFFIAT